MRRLPVIIPLTFLIVCYFSLFHELWENRNIVRAKTPAGYTIPSKYSRLLSLGHRGVLSDYLFLKTSTFVGGRGVAGQVLNAEDWNFFEQSLSVIVDLDPYFIDPYVLAEGYLAWDAGKPEVANQLLKKGMKYRSDDWWLPFYVGFNTFYFLKDYESAAKYIMQAASLPGSPSYLKSLGARLAYYGGKSKTGLLFLEEMLLETKNETLKKRLELRRLALERAVLIEEALDKYRKTMKAEPSSLQDLVTQGYLIELPVDPYGGKWGVLKSGRVFSSSKFVEPKK